MKVYLAGSAIEQARIQVAADVLRSHGHEVTSSWLEDADVGQGANLDRTIDDTRAAARADLVDVWRADAIVMLVPLDKEDLRAHSGGRHVEVGFAIGMGKRVVIVGTPENIFERCAILAGSVHEALEALQ